MNELNLEKLEKVDFEIDEDALDPKTIYCCDSIMKKKTIEIQLDNEVFIKVKGFECKKCNKNYLSLSEAKKLDKGMILSRAFGKGFKLKRKLSFDGDNYILRIPREFTFGIDKKREIEIIPLGDKEFCAYVL